MIVPLSANEKKTVSEIKTGYTEAKEAIKVNFDKTAKFKRKVLLKRLSINRKNGKLNIPTLTIKSAEKLQNQVKLHLDYIESRTKKLYMSKGDNSDEIEKDLDDYRELQYRAALLDKIINDKKDTISLTNLSFNVDPTKIDVDFSEILDELGPEPVKVPTNNTSEEIPAEIIAAKMRETNELIAEEIERLGKKEAAKLIKLQLKDEKAQYENAKKNNSETNPITSKLLDISTDIRDILDKIHKDLVDEQDTSIKGPKLTSTVAPTITPPAATETEKEEEDKPQSGFDFSLPGLRLPRGKAPKGKSTKGSKPRVRSGKPGKMPMMGGGKGIFKGLAKTAKFLGPVGAVLGVGMAGYDAYAGWNAADENLGIGKEKLTTKNKASSALGGVISGLTFGLADEKNTSKGINNLLGGNEAIKKYEGLGIIDHDLIGYSEVKDWAKLESLAPNEIKEIISIDDWRKADLQKMVDTLNKKVSSNTSQIANINKQIAAPPAAPPAPAPAAPPQQSGGATPAKKPSGVVADGKIKDPGIKIPSTDIGKKPVNEVVEGGKGFTIIKREDGSVERREGDRNWRNNNPGNLIQSQFSKTYGSVGDDGRFAVFPDYTTGREAKRSLIFGSPSYVNLPLTSAIARYAPAFENNTSKYTSMVLNAVGGQNLLMSQYDKEQQEAILNTMQRVEGNRIGEIYALDGSKISSAPKVAAGGGGGGGGGKSGGGGGKSGGGGGGSVGDVGSNASVLKTADGTSGNAPSKMSGGFSAIKTSTGKSVKVASEWADKFQGFINDLESTGYKIKDLGGYANRNMVGGTKPSYHALGAAIDINPSKNPYYKEDGRPLVTDMPSNTGELAAKWGLGWGGNWKTIKDAMHFSVAKGEGGTVPLSRGNSLTSAPDTPASKQKLDKAAKGSNAVDAASSDGGNTPPGTEGSGGAGGGAPSTDVVSENEEYTLPGDEGWTSVGSDEVGDVGEDATVLSEKLPSGETVATVEDPNVFREPQNRPSKVSEKNKKQAPQKNLQYASNTKDELDRLQEIKNELIITHGQEKGLAEYNRIYGEKEKTLTTQVMGEGTTSTPTEKNNETGSTVASIPGINIPDQQTAESNKPEAQVVAEASKDKKESESFNNSSQLAQSTKSYDTNTAKAGASSLAATTNINNLKTEEKKEEPLRLLQLFA